MDNTNVKFLSVYKLSRRMRIRSSVLTAPAGEEVVFFFTAITSNGLQVAYSMFEEI